MASSLDLPASLALDPDGNLMIMDQANQVLRYVDKAGEIHRFAGKCVVDAAAPAGPGPCSSITPFGEPVVPEVKRMWHRSFGCTASMRQPT